MIFFQHLVVLSRRFVMAGVVFLFEKAGIHRSHAFGLFGLGDVGQQFVMPFSPGDARHQFRAAQLFQHAKCIDRAITDGLAVGVRHNEQIHRPVLFEIAPPVQKIFHDAFDFFSQRRPAEILVLDVDELSRVVDGLQVELLDVSLVVLTLGSEYLRHDRCAMPGTQAQLPGDVSTRPQQVNARFFFPGSTKIVIQKFQHRAGHTAGNVLPGRLAVAPELRMMPFMAVMIVVPIGIQRVVPHHEPDGILRFFVVHQHHLLVMARLGKHRHRTHDFVGHVAIFIQRIHRQAPGNFCPVQQAKVARDKFDILDAQAGIVTPPQHAKKALPQFDRPGFSAGIGEPDLAIPQLVILDLRIVSVLPELAKPIGNVVTRGRVFRSLGDTQRVVPAQDPHLNAFVGFLDQQITNAQRTGIAPFEIHRRLKAPADDFHAAFSGEDGVIDRAECTLAIHQRFECRGHRMVFGVLHEPRQVELA
ncbi:hypothetical protein D3C86_1107320 [compost metagenome]